MINARGIASQIANDIMVDVENDVRTAMSNVTKRASEDWERMARRMMDMYYSDHSKTTGRYHITGSLRNVIVPIMKIGDICEFGVEFDYSRMNHGALPKFNEYSIWENFMYGAHGNEAYTVPSTGQMIDRNVVFSHPNTNSVLLDYFDSYDKILDRYFEDEFKKI